MVDYYSGDRDLAKQVKETNIENNKCATELTLWLDTVKKREADWQKDKKTIPVGWRRGGIFSKNKLYMKSELKENLEKILNGIKFKIEKVMKEYTRSHEVDRFYEKVLTAISELKNSITNDSVEKISEKLTNLNNLLLESDYKIHVLEAFSKLT